MRKNPESAITLVALVITIIILLILAGISIATLGGPNGLITRSKEAKEKYQIEKEKEEISLIIMENKINKVTSSEQEDSLEKEFEKKIKQK